MKHLLAVISLLLVSTGDAFLFFSRKEVLSPVILVPGYGGSQLDAKLQKTTRPSFLCPKNANWFNIWLNREELFRPALWCWIDNMKLTYDNVSRTTQNTPGVTIRVPGWGDPAVVEWIDPTKPDISKYFVTIADLLTSLGYERRRNIFGAPYDFRKAPNEQQQWFEDLKNLVEYAYEMNSNTPVTFISHSMGSPMTLVFLQQQSFKWQDKYIKRFISLAGAWGGTVKAMKVFAMGDNLQSFLLSGALLKAEEITNPSTAWLLPSPLFWKTSEVLVQSPSRNYTVTELRDFFIDIDYYTGWEMRKDTIWYSLNLSPAKVEIHCLYGGSIDTVERLKYKKDNLVDQTPTLIMGRGDGTVNERSLRGCHIWKGHERANVTNVELHGVDHLAVLSNPDVLSYISSILKT